MRANFWGALVCSPADPLLFRLWKMTGKLSKRRKRRMTRNTTVADPGWRLHRLRVPVRCIDSWSSDGQVIDIFIFCSPGATRRGGLQKKGSLAEGRIDPDVDIYAIPSQGAEDGKEIYFLALVDILTHYGQCLVCRPTKLNCTVEAQLKLGLP